MTSMVELGGGVMSEVEGATMSEAESGGEPMTQGVACRVGHNPVTEFGPGNPSVSVTGTETGIRSGDLEEGKLFNSFINNAGHGDMAVAADKGGGPTGELAW